MSGGLTTYPRTGGGGGSDLATIRNLIGRVNSPDLASNEANARQLVAALERFANGTARATPMDIVGIANEVRNALFAARAACGLGSPFHERAMEICAAAYKAAVPFPGTGLASRSQIAIAGATAAGVTLTGKRGCMEDVGLIATLYEISALLGEDVSKTILVNALTLNGKWMAARDSGGNLTYLEPAASYNVNVMIRVDIPGCSEPLIIVGEAKGGSSSYGEVKGPASITSEFGISPPVKQDTIEYAVSRASYMSREIGQAPHQVARREAGQVIRQAWKEGRLAYVAARGDISPTQMQTTRLDFFGCK